MSVLNLKSPTELSGFYVIYKGSSNLEYKSIRGISHLLEHLVYKALDPYQDELDRLGIISNAYTSDNEIVFYITGLESSLSLWRNRLVSLIQEFKITELQFQLEKSVVIQEYDDYFAIQDHNHWYNLERRLFNNYGPIGSRKDLESITLDDCIKHFNIQFGKPSQIINVSNNHKFKYDNFQSDIITNTPNFLDTTEEIEYVEFNSDSTSIILSGSLHDKYPQQSLLINSMFSSGLQSPMYQELREKRGLVYGVSSSLSKLGDKFYNYVSTSTDKKNADRVMDIILSIFDNYKMYITRERFDLVIANLKIRKQISDINRYKSVTSYINGPGWDSYDILDSVTYDDIMDILDRTKLFNSYDFYRSRMDLEFK